MLTEKKVLEILSKRKLTLSVAESCTGGLLSHCLTNVPGSSKVFLCGIIAYSNASKIRILGIPKGIIQTKGAVSSETAKLMAINVRRLSNSSIGIAITGIAGPGGGTKLKPAGTVFIAAASDRKVSTKEFHFSGNRLEIKRKAANQAIKLILQCLI